MTLMRLKPTNPRSRVKHSALPPFSVCMYACVHVQEHVSRGCGYSREYKVKTVLSVHWKIDKTKVVRTNGSLMKVKSIVECSREHSTILLTCVTQYSVFKTYF